MPLIYEMILDCLFVDPSACIVFQSFNIRLSYYAMFAFIFLLYANGSGLGFMLLIVAFNYSISRLLAGTVLCPLMTWIFNASILVRNVHQIPTVTSLIRYLLCSSLMLFACFYLWFVC